MLRESKSGCPYRYCTQCGTADPREETPQLYVCTACGHRHFINPIAAVVGLLANRQGEVLLIRRAKDPGAGLIGLPGGFVDVGETGEEALAREIFEEVHLEVALSEMSYFLSLPNEYAYQGLVTPVMDVFYLVRLGSFAGAHAKEEVSGLEPTALAEVPLEQVAFPSNRRALRQLQIVGLGG